MKKKNTGLAFSEVRGLLNNLNDNLSGENGDYWLNALKKMLRREELPKPPAKILKILEGFDARKMAQKKMDDLITYLQSIAVVHEVKPCDGEVNNDLLDILVYPTLGTFLRKETGGYDTALFSLKSDGTIEEVGGLPDGATDEIYDAWEFNDWSLKGFIEALLKLGVMYKDAIPVIEN